MSSFVPHRTSFRSTRRRRAKPACQLHLFGTEGMSTFPCSQFICPASSFFPPCTVSNMQNKENTAHFSMYHLGSSACNSEPLPTLETCKLRLFQCLDAFTWNPQTPSSSSMGSIKQVHSLSTARHDPQHCKFMRHLHGLHLQMETPQQNDNPHQCSTQTVSMFLFDLL